MRIISAKELDQQGSELLSELKKEETTLLTDANGRPAAYLVDPKAYEGLHSKLRLLEGIARGERAIQEGRVFSHAQAKKKMSRWLKRK